MNGLLIADLSSRNRHSSARAFGLNTLYCLLAKRFSCTLLRVRSYMKLLYLRAFARRRNRRSEYILINLDTHFRPNARRCTLNPTRQRFYAQRSNLARRVCARVQNVIDSGGRVINKYRLLWFARYSPRSYSSQLLLAARAPFPITINGSRTLVR